MASTKTQAAEVSNFKSEAAIGQKTAAALPYRHLHSRDVTVDLSLRCWLLLMLKRKSSQTLQAPKGVFEHIQRTNKAVTKLSDLACVSSAKERQGGGRLSALAQPDISEPHKGTPNLH